MAKPVLEKIIKSSLLHSKDALMVFDLDSTLFDVSPRLEKIMKDFANQPEILTKFSSSAKKLSSIQFLPTDWGIKGAFLRTNLDKEPAEFLEKAKQFWHNNFFSDHYLKFDTAFEQAAEFIQTLQSAGSHIAYLTGRDTHRMGKGSIEKLKADNFPINDTATLHLKPQAGDDDGDFKLRWFKETSEKKYKEIWFVENEPVNLHLVMNHLPHINCIFFESTHAGKKSPPTSIPRIKDFKFK
jgi:hypothetical protein